MRAPILLLSLGATSLAYLTLSTISTGIVAGLLVLVMFLSNLFPRLRFYLRLSGFVSGLLATAAWVCSRLPPPSALVDRDMVDRASSLP